ncbi:MAG: hypothetical protein PHY93_10015 [Bacteriovorax sp.]|nr:hypothetical protein [Bacteriovorax sp.]
MRFVIKIFISVSLLLGLASCGVDKLKETGSSSQSSLTGNKECSFTSEGPLVCGMDGKEYVNKEQAECITTVKHAGHCQCSQSIIVCGSDGFDHNECEAIDNPNYIIVKIAPCSSTGL